MLSRAIVTNSNFGLTRCPFSKRRDGWRRPTPSSFKSFQRRKPGGVDLPFIFSFICPLLYAGRFSLSRSLDFLSLLSPLFFSTFSNRLLRWMYIGPASSLPLTFASPPPRSCALCLYPISTSSHSVPVLAHPRSFGPCARFHQFCSRHVSRISLFPSRSATSH